VAEQFVGAVEQVNVHARNSPTDRRDVGRGLQTRLCVRRRGSLASSTPPSASAAPAACHGLSSSLKRSQPRTS
jgi:hypothetical protein